MFLSSTFLNCHVHYHIILSCCLTFPLFFSFPSSAYCLLCKWLIIQLNSGKVVAVGPGCRDRDGKLIPVHVKEGDTVLLPEYGGTEVKLADKP